MNIDILRIRRERWQNNRRIREMAKAVTARSQPGSQKRPVIFFNASTRLTGLSLNAAYQMLTAWALRLSGIPVIHFVCQQGLSRCVLGTNRDHPADQPPCRLCQAQSRAIYSGATVRAFSSQLDPGLKRQLENLSLPELENSSCDGMPLGKLVMPSLRWILRRLHLPDDGPTRLLAREYLLSAYHLAQEFEALLAEVHPQSVVVFNGQFYPEAVARWISSQHGVPSFTHEVGLRPLSAFFTPGEATAYPIDIPHDFELSQVENQQLDEYLSKRFKGDFSMAGIRFWPEMNGLSGDFLHKMEGFSQVVPVFTNVIFDTSQPHSNVVFPDMFAWLESVLKVIRSYPETLFVIRAHPDEKRPGKESRESVRQWVDQNRVEELPNVAFIDSHETISSYELIQRSKFVMVYNSTIGLEASILGMPVLCAGRARYTQVPTVFFPHTQEAFRQQLQEFLSSKQIEIPSEFQRNARRFLYYQVFKTSLPFDEFLEPDGIWPGFVRLKPFSVDQLNPKHSETIRVILDGLLAGKSFLLGEATTHGG
jgi:hypothetical protein